MINVDVSVKAVIYVKKIIFGILLHVVAKMANIMHDSVITSNKFIGVDAEAKTCVETKSYDKETKIIQTNFNEKKVTCKAENFCILLTLLLITIALLIAVSIYC